MPLKFIQVNIYKGKYFGSLVNFLKKEDPDFIAAQEVTYGALNYTEDKTINLFDALKEKLGYFGAVNFDWLVRDAKGSLGNAVFSKTPIKGSEILLLRDAKPVKMAFVDSEMGFPTAPRHVIDAVVELGGRDVHVMSWHGAWTAPPTDTEETLRQSKIVRDYLAKLNDQNIPFLLGGDLNSTLDKKTVQMISEVSNNLMLNSGIKQTTHPKIHKIAPKGFLIDFIFTSSHFKMKSLSVPEITVSDHLPVIAELELT